MQSINWAQVITSVLIALISSTGLWSYIANYRNKHDAKTRLLIGLAHDRIIYLGTQYIEVCFHDNPTEAAWIIGNTGAVAEAICRGLCNYYGVTYIPMETKPTGRYDTLDDIPGYAYNTIRKLIEKEYIKGTGTGLDLSLDIIRMFVILDRAGAFD